MASKTFAVAEKDRYLLKFLRVSLSRSIPTTTLLPFTFAYMQ